MNQVLFPVSAMEWIICGLPGILLLLFIFIFERSLHKKHKDWLFQLLSVSRTGNSAGSSDRDLSFAMVTAFLTIAGVLILVVGWVTYGMYRAFRNHDYSFDTGAFSNIALFLALGLVPYMFDRITSITDNRESDRQSERP